MRSFFWLLLLITTLLPVCINGKEKVEISLITCSPGDEFYSTFGHSALRVYAPSSNIDVIYNFGIFDFRAPNFYLNFLRGRLSYMLGVQTMESFMYIYSSEGRAVYEQKLSLTDSEQSALLQQLEFLYQPQNRYYRYSFLSKNCTTELRDLFFKYLSVSNTEFFKRRSQENSRDLLNDYMRDKKWIKLGVNTILGSELDREIDLKKSMFLPDVLMKYTDSIRVAGSPLIYDKSVLVQPSGESAPTITEKLTQPIISFGIICLLYIGLLIFTKMGRYLIPSFLLLVGVLGIFIGGLILFTDHTELHWNWNLLWCNPIYLPLAILVFTNKCKHIQKALLAISMFCSVAAIVIWLAHVQYMEPVFAVVLLMLLVSKAKLLKQGFGIWVSASKSAK